MFIISVAPITRGIAKEELSYYSNEVVSPGDIISVPLRTKNIPAVVTHVEDVRAKKAALRSASFSVKKAGKILARRPFSPTFIDAVQKAVTYTASTTGSVLNAVLPKALLTKPITQKENSRAQSDTHEVSALQDSEETRIAYYKSVIREQFAKNQSALCILPTKIDTEHFFELLKRGVEKHTVLIHTGFTQKKQRNLWEDISARKHPVLVVATPRFLSLPIPNLGIIIVEREHSRHYKHQSKPYIDYRTFARMLAQTQHTSLIFGDELLRLETLEEAKKHNITPIGKLRMHYNPPVPVEIADMRIDPQEPTRRFQTIGGNMQVMITDMHSVKDRCFVFTLRKGLYPVTVCGDCDQLVTCKQCSAPVVVHARPGKAKNIFTCHRCHTSRSAHERCTRCGSWNLTPLGVGSQRVVSDLKVLFPDRKIFHMNTETLTPSRMKKTAKQWADTEKSILVGTEAALSYIQKPTHIAVASMDTLFALPDFRARERMFNTFIFLRNRAAKQLIIQTRSPEDAIFEYALRGNVLTWYQDELAERKVLAYPPSTTLIKIITQGSSTILKKYAAELSKELAGYETRTFPAFTARVRGKEIMHTLVTLPSGTWPEEKLVTKLQNLPPQHAVNVDPEHLL